MRHHSPRLHHLNMIWITQYLLHVTADHVSRPITITVLGPFLIKVEKFRNKDHSTSSLHLGYKFPYTNFVPSELKNLPSNCNNQIEINKSGLKLPLTKSSS